MATTIDLGKLYCLKEDKKDYYGREYKYQLGDNVGVSSDQELIGDTLVVKIDWVVSGENYSNWYYYEKDLEEYLPIPLEEML